MKNEEMYVGRYEFVFPVIAVMLNAIKTNNKETSDVKRPEFAG